MRVRKIECSGSTDGHFGGGVCAGFGADGQIVVMTVYTCDMLELAMLEWLKFLYCKLKVPRHT